MDAALLPVSEPADSSDTRWALETARTLWLQGERREALRWIRRAAEAASEAGADDRALTLAKVGAELRGVLDIPRTEPPPPMAPAAPNVVFAPTPAASPLPLVHAAPNVASAPPPVPLARFAPPPLQAAPAPAASVAPKSVPRIDRPSSAAVSDGDLVVTVVSTDGAAPPPNGSIVSHRAVRVAVMAVAPGARELRVRRLSEGEVAPKDATVALLVAFEPGGSPIPH